jgi:hypothetical protein
VFTAEQQKYTYEVKKALIYQEHVLCERCFKERNKLEAASKAFLQSWSKNKAALKAKPGQLIRWREIVELLPKYGVRQDTARIRMLARLIRNAARVPCESRAAVRSARQSPRRGTTPSSSHSPRRASKRRHASK